MHCQLQPESSLHLLHATGTGLPGGFLIDLVREKAPEVPAPEETDRPGCDSRTEVNGAGIIGHQEPGRSNETGKLIQ